jgi:hypothetical protein
MTINLKQIRTLDTDNIKLDKINYNFDQLIANGGGPKGFIGPDGNTGPQGFQGALGFQGNRGIQGFQGSDASSSGATYWNVIPQNTSALNVMATMFAKHPIDPPSVFPLPPIPVPEFPAIVAAGYKGSDSAYREQQSQNVNPYLYQWVVNRQNNFSSNLRFTSSDINTNSFDATMDISQSPGETFNSFKLNFDFIVPQNSQLNLQAGEHIIRNSGSSGGDFLKISNTSGSINNIDTVFSKGAIFNKQIKIGGSNANTDKVATSANNLGLVNFKTVEEIGGSIKSGTIISILPSIFSDPTKFVCTQTIDTSDNPDVPIQIRMGAGIGDYKGWYVCNGKTWTNGTPSIEIEVPDLNSYAYQITSNPLSTDPESQGNVNVINDEIYLIGGADTSMSANWPIDNSGIYNTTLVNNSNDPQIATNNSSSSFKIKKLPQIIYLRTEDLYWVDKGTGQLSSGDYISTDYNTADYNVF